MQNYYYQPQRSQINPTIPQQQNLFLKGRPVSNIEEVRAAAIDFDGSVFFFPDLANGRIYTKQCNIDGTAAFNMYELKEMPMESTTISNDNFITREEFNKTMGAVRQALMKIAKIEPANNGQTSSQELKADDSPLEFNF